ncbi:MAG: fimbria/pilus outer membrane usher protein [Pseudomonadota bacterium]
MRYSRLSQPYLRLSDLGVYAEDERKAQSTLTLFARLREPVRVSLAGTKLFDAPAALHEGPAFRLNVLGTVREVEGTSGPGYVSVLDSSVSIGRFGTLYGGYRFSRAPDQDMNQERLPVFLEKHFINELLTLRLGEVRASSDINDTSYGIAGFELRKNFATRPDLSYLPTYNFFTDLQGPSVVELFVNGQRNYQQEFSQPGEVQLSDYRPSGDGRVTLVVTDASGARRIIETDFYSDSDRLQTGVSAYSVAGGLFRDADGKVHDSGLLSARWQHGVTAWLTAGVFGDAAFFVADDPLARGRERAQSGGVNASLGTPVGSFSGSVRWRSDDLEQDGMSSRLNWRFSQRLRWAIASGGVNYIREIDYRTLLDDARDLSGYRAYLGVALPYVSLTASHYDIDDQKGTQVALGSNLGPASVSLSWQTLNDSDAILGAGLTLPLGRSSVRASTFHQPASGLTQYRLEGRTSFADRRGSLFLGGITDDEGSLAARRLSAGLAYRGDRGTAAYEYRELSGNREQLLDFTTAFALGPRGKPGWLPLQPDTSGIAVVDVGIPGVRVSSAGQSRVSDSRGLVLLPVNGFTQSFAALDEKTLPSGYYATKQAVDVSVMPGQSAYMWLKPRVQGVFIKVPGAKKGDQVTVNEHGHPVYDFGVYCERLRAGSNTIDYKGRRWTLTVSTSEPLSEYVLEN